MKVSFHHVHTSSSCSIFFSFKTKQKFVITGKKRKKTTHQLVNQQPNAKKRLQFSDSRYCTLIGEYIWPPIR